MRLGGPLFEETHDPDSWIVALERKGYRAAYCPIGVDADSDAIDAYRRAASERNIVIAETGAWSNPLSDDSEERGRALELCRNQLELADRIGAKCCVNISGSRGPRWDGPDARNLTGETFDMIVECVRGIIDAVKPERAVYALETMPWAYPDSAESYDQLIVAIDRPRFGVHFDPVNLVCSPQRYYASGDLIRDFVERVGPHIVSCHAKDILLRDSLTTHLDEVRPGLGGLDYGAYLESVVALDPDVCVMLEHLTTEDEYDEAAGHLRAVAGEKGLSFA